ncbi:MAG: ArsR family transcriptional regulator [Candidatus Diapherotrites archaeon]|nr:ArsR family transcriptional regulator [Candidatus Diapherotrites archaeon]
MNKLIIYIGREMEKDEKALIKGKNLNQPKNALYLNSFEELNKLLSPKRIDLLKYLIESGSDKTVNELASDLNRKQEAISRDLHYLKNLDLINLRKSKQSVLVSAEFDSIKIEV